MIPNILAITNILSWTLIGSLIGALVYVRNRNYLREGVIATILTGALGGLFGGFVGNIIFGGGVSGFAIVSVITALIAAVALSLIQVNVFEKRDLRAGVLKNRPNYNFAYFQQLQASRSKKSKKSTKTTKATRDDIDKSAFKDHGWLLEFSRRLDFPISKRDMIRYAEDSGASRTVVAKLESIEDHIYEDSKQLDQQIEKVS